MAAGCRVDEHGRLRFPRALVEDVIARTRRKFTLHGIDPMHDIEIGGRRVHTGTGGAAPTIMDFETGRYRESTVADLYDIARLVDALPEVDAVLTEGVFASESGEPPRESGLRAP